MTESEDHKAYRSPADAPEDHDVVRNIGTVAIVVGVAVSFGILIFEERFPSWPWLVGLWIMALIGVGLRIEAAIRERRRS
ncbi:hypothetical protein HII36_04600 [Nonomuraea sp. NN258]|uniref:hypothetical protein n=1 Tax=Nonomuraea antri TaxID=2730852 RepID=UPI00156A2048|nr:hypothetical protein [Nonomuraea antri]NRQ31115.1 hypothetical protein [Nonomuraea antri]